MGKPFFGANSLLDDPLVTTVVSVAADAAFPVANLNDDREWSPYKMGSSNVTLTITSDAGVGNTRTVDYFMLVGHDLFNPNLDGLGPITSLFFERSADGVVFTTIFAITPASLPVGSIADNKIIARFFTTPIVDRAFRLRIERPANAFIASLGELQYGKAVQIPTGVQRGFDPNVESTQVRRTQSQTGNILGATERFADRSAAIAISLLSTAFIDGTALGDFKDFWDNHASKMLPFLWHWNPDADVSANPGQFEKDAFFAIIEPQTRIARPLSSQIATGLRDLNFNVVGLKEE